jgi:CubicO group peptidase (beta-lactamase class C family)
MPSIRSLIAVASLLLAAGDLRAQEAKYTDSRTPPDTPAARRAQEIAALLQDDDPARIRAYVEKELAPPLRDLPMDVHLAFFADLHERSGGRLEVHGFRAYDPPHPATKATLIVRNHLAESWQAIVVEVEPEAPHRVRDLDYSRARPPRDRPKGERLTPAEVAEKLGAYVDKLARAEAFGGTVLLAKDGQVLSTRVSGLANRDFAVPNTLDTKFNLGSMNKMFTGVAVLQLVEQGKLSLDDPIGKYVDETWAAADVRAKVKVKHLLTHTSGLGSYFNDAFFKSSRALYRNVDDYKPLVRDETLTFEPGTRWSYSNTGMLLAGAVIERAAGTDYFEYVRRHVTGPAGMASTDCYELDAVNPNLAVGYERQRTAQGTSVRNNVFAHVLRGGPAGGGYSTVHDLFRFGQALRGGKLLSTASLQQLWSPHPEVASPGYGYGFATETTPVGRIVGHSGGFTGISAYLSLYLDEGYTVAVLSNHGGAATLVENKARELILQGR